MSLTARELDRAWDKLGMEIRESKHRNALLRVDGKLVLRTARSHGTRMLDGKIPNEIRKQMRLNKQQFEDLIACPLGRDGYLKILEQQGLIPSKD